MSSKQQLWFIISCLLMYALSCGTGYMGPEVHSGPISVSATVNTDGEFALGGSFSKRLVGTDFIGVDWVIGFEKTFNEAVDESYHLFIVWEDDLGDVWRDEYDIGQPFEVAFDQQSWVRKIRNDNNGNIIVAVESLRVSGRHVKASRPTFREIERLPNLWNKAGYRDITTPTGSESKSYFVTVNSNDEWRWGFSWHASDLHTLREILKPFSMELLGKIIKFSNFGIRRCRFKGMALRSMGDEAE